MSGQRVILFNASNMESFPVYPYAFVQVPAIARQAGIEVICQELLGIPERQWQETIRRSIERHRPAMVLVTLRNTDSLNARDYVVDQSRDERKPAYFPIEQTRKLIAAIRSVSGLKVVLGGFGFSLLADELMPYLRPDIGVFGGPDDFFAHFQDVLEERFSGIANLLYIRDGQLISNPRTYFPPFSQAEYTPKAIEEMMAFYDTFPSPGFQGAAVEIIRGCCHTCVFCAEPHVVGHTVQYRKLPAVMADIQMLVDHGVTKIYMISSELNPSGNSFLLQLADRINSFNERQPQDRQVSWFGANYLLNLTMDEYERLHQSGFTGGWFDITALVDENARVMRTPYQNKSLVGHLKTYIEFKKMVSEPEKVSQANTTGEVKHESKKIPSISWSMFLGNPATTTATIRNTLRVANWERLAQRFDSCHIVAPLRVFDYQRPSSAVLARSHSVNTKMEHTDYQQLLPSFAYPPALLSHFGSLEEVKEMFGHISDTYLSTKYQETRDWQEFLRKNATADSIAGWAAQLSTRKGVELFDRLGMADSKSAAAVVNGLYAEEPQNEASLPNTQAKRVVDALLEACFELFPAPLNSLNLPDKLKEFDELTSYQIAAAVFRRWENEEQILDELSGHSVLRAGESLVDFFRFCVKALFYRYGVLIRPKYRALFVD